MNWSLIPIFISFFCGTVCARAETVEKIVAVVNDQVILQSDVSKYKTRLVKGGMVDDLLVSNAKETAADQSHLLDVMVNERLIDSEVQRQGLSVTIERVEAEIKRVAATNNISRAQLKHALSEQGVDFSDYQDFTKKRIERHSLIEKVITSKITISDDDIAAFYLQQKGTTSSKETFQFKLSHILFLPKGGDVTGAKARADAVLEKLQSGKTFETLASQFSEDPSFSPGGALGTFKTGEFLPEIEKAVVDLPLNATTGVVKTRVGFHIVKLLEKTLIASPDFEQNKPKIQSYLAEQAFKKQFRFWLDQKRQDAFVRVN